jgi:hypothetical protein
MQTISSSNTFLIKKVLPAIWFAIVCFGGIVTALSGVVANQPMVLVGPVLMLVLGFFLFRKLIWDMADEVRDGGDYLLVRRGDVEERVPLSNVMNVSLSQFTNPRRLTLRLRSAGKFGDEVVFIPASSFRFSPLARNPVAEDLMRRVDSLRHPETR